MNILAENILSIYLLVFVSVLAFDIVTIFSRKMNDSHLAKLEFLIDEMIEEENKSHVSKEHKRVLVKKLKRINYFIAFTSVIERMEEKKRKTYLSNIRDVFVELYPYYRDSEIVKETYFVHFLSQYSNILLNDKNSLINYVINCTKSPSLYLRENALNVLYNVGNEEYIEEAFRNMNYFEIEHHHKLLTDGLLRFTGDPNDLGKMLLSEIENYRENYKVACINYFAYKRIPCREEVYKILVSSFESKEVRIACIRYFTSVPYEPVLPVLEEFLKDDKNNWEYSAVAASAMSKYPSKKVANLLVAATQSHNWYVRNNAAASLIHLTKKEKHKELIDRIDDKYAKDALRYQLHLRKEEI